MGLSRIGLACTAALALAACSSSGNGQTRRPASTPTTACARTTPTVAAPTGSSETRKVIGQDGGGCVVATGAATRPTDCNGLRIYMRTTATATDIGRVEAALRSDTTVSARRFLDHAAAYAAAKTLFRDDPDLLLDVKPADLPEYFEAHTAAGSGPARFVARYGHLHGVTNVTPLNFCVTAKTKKQIEQLQHHLTSSAATVQVTGP